VADLDAELVAAIRRGDGDGVERLVDRYGDRAYRLALLITGTAPEAEEVVVEALQTAIRSVQLFDAAATFESWILRGVASVAYRTLRSREPHTSEITSAEVMPLLDSDGHFEPMDDWSMRIDRKAAKRELYGLLSGAIGGLPVDYRIALVLHDVESVSKAEIAEILGIDVPGVIRRVHYARLFLRKRLSEYFGAAAAA